MKNHLRKNVPESDYNKRKKTTTLSREEETLYTIRYYYRRTNGKRSAEFSSKASHTPSGKMEEPIFPGMAYLRGQISIAILRGTSRRIQGTRTPFYLKGYCEDGAGTHLFA